jgi:hypothetical protein
MTTHALAQPRRSERISRAYRARGYLFREAMAVGVGFGLVMVYIAVASIAAWRMVAFRNTAQRWAHGLVGGLPTGSTR